MESVELGSLDVLGIQFLHARQGELGVVLSADENYPEVVLLTAGNIEQDDKEHNFVFFADVVAALREVAKNGMDVEEVRVKRAAYQEENGSE